MKPTTKIKLLFVIACLLAFLSSLSLNDLINTDDLKSETPLGTNRITFSNNRTRTSLIPVTISPKISQNSTTTPTTAPLSRSNPSQYNPSPSIKRRRLELIHIPKTGGTSMEAAYSKHFKGRWGACHFMTWRYSLQVSGGALSCPKSTPKLPTQVPKYQEYVASNFATYGCQLWHTPSYIFDMMLPSDETTQSKYNPYYNADLFAVIRNPYDRIIRCYYYKLSKRATSEEKLLSTVNATHMNDWIIENLKPRIWYDFASSFPFNSTRGKYCIDGGHFVPQYRYIYHPYDTQNQIVKHILRFEDGMSTPLNDLLLLFNYSSNLTLPHAYQTKSDGSSSANERKWTRNDLTNKTRLLIQKVYAKDFELFNYSTIT